ncbi:MAG: cytidylate kinase-like family protein [Blautia sp.]|nr:cytidylate kinase-like family protein [Blautia sp.]
MTYNCITIARQYGSGGRSIGEILSKRLGIGYYDKDIIRMASEDSGINEALFGRVDEHTGTKPGFFSRSGSYGSGALIPPPSRDFISDDNLFNYQARVIRHLAETESCVIIGRCANFLLKDYPNVLRVFIHADWAVRMEWASKKLSMSEKELERFLRKDDKRKEDFCRHYTGHEWTDVTQYDLCLDTGRLGYDRCVEEIMKLSGMKPVSE